MRVVFRNSLTWTRTVSTAPVALHFPYPLRGVIAVVSDFLGLPIGAVHIEPCKRLKKHATWNVGTAERKIKWKEKVANVCSNIMTDKWWILCGKNIQEENLVKSSICSQLFLLWGWEGRREGQQEKEGFDEIFIRPKLHIYACSLCIMYCVSGE